MQQQEEVYITCTQAAALLGISTQRISTLMTQGIIRFHMLGTQRCPYKSSVLDYQQNPNRKHTPKRGRSMPRYLRLPQPESVTHVS